MNFRQNLHYRACARPWRVGLLALILTVSVLANLQAAPQSEDDESLILRFGPDPQLFHRERVENALRAWKWQSELSKRQQQLIGETRSKWQKRLDGIHEKLSEVRSQLAKSGLSYPLDVRAVQLIDEEIRSLKSEIVGISAQLKQVKKDAELATQDLKFERESQFGELELLRKRKEILLEEYFRTEKLVEQQALPNSRLTELKANVDEMDVMVHNQERKLQLIAARLEGQYPLQVGAIVEEQESLKSRLQELLNQREVVQKLQPLQAIESLKAEAEMARQMIEMAQVRQFDLQLDNTRYEALIQLAEERLSRQQDEESEIE
jgi:hypothetical protein